MGKRCKVGPGLTSKENVASKSFFLNITRNSALFPEHDFFMHASTVYNKHGQVLTNTKKSHVQKKFGTMRQNILEFLTPPLKIYSKLRARHMGSANFELFSACSI